MPEANARNAAPPIAWQIAEGFAEMQAEWARDIAAEEELERLDREVARLVEIHGFVDDRILASAGLL